MVISRGFHNYQELEKLAKQYSQLDISSVEACLYFLDTTAEVYQAFDSHFARYGLSMGKFTILIQLFVASKSGLTPSDFAERSGVTRATVTGLLDGLEKEELVKRQPYPEDRRRLTIVLTQKGRKLISEMLPDHFCRTTSMMSHLTDDEKKMFINLLTKLRTGTSAMREV
ncbi:MAG: MarR family transcriptional regulator [Cyanobacteria bacterium P01_A01_bin.45]